MTTVADQILKRATKKKAIRDLLEHPGYMPNRLLNVVMEKLGAKNDFQMCKILGVESATLFRMRSREQQITSDLMIAIMDETGMSLKEIRDLAGLAHKSRGTRPKAIEAVVEEEIESVEEQQS